MIRSQSFPHVLRLIAGAFFLTGAQAQTNRDEVRCNYTKRSVCTASGCTEIPGGPAFLSPHPLQRPPAAS